MKKVRMILSAAIVFAVVGTSLAFTKTHKDIFQCLNQTCQVQSDGRAYSSFVNGAVVTPPETPYIGNAGDKCETPDATCTPYSGNVYINQ